MTSKLFIVFLALAFMFGVWNCEDVAPTSTKTIGGTSPLQGTVRDLNNSQPILNAYVYLSLTNQTDSVYTGADGKFQFQIDLTKYAGTNASITVSKNGYHPQSTSFLLGSGATVLQDILLSRDTTVGIRDTSQSSLYAHSIALISVSNEEVAVYGVGGVESSILTWEVRDSLGFPIDINHQDTVLFQLNGTPVAGGAYVSPAKALTNASGRVATTVNSGTVSGVLQFVATLHRRTDGVTLQSTPVIITVNAGLPDLAHFSVGPAALNFPGYDWINHTNQITVQVGDKYSNPVKVGTAVYFSTTGGVIAASGFTDATSHATVTLYSGNPRPSDPLLGVGFAWVRASTMGQGGAAVLDSVPVLFSGVAILSNVNPTTIAVPKGGASGPIHFTVSDENGNPLAAGTQITVTLQYTAPPNSGINITATGDVSVLLGDTQSRGAGITNFTFQVVDQTVGGVGSTIPVTAVISVTSPNGNPPKVQIVGTVG